MTTYLGMSVVIFIALMIKHSVNFVGFSLTSTCVVASSDVLNLNFIFLHFNVTKRCFNSCNIILACVFEK